MNRVLFSGKIFNEEELKRVNTILQTQAALVWASVRTYSFEYQKGRKKYYEGYTSGSEATSDWSNDRETINYVNGTLLPGKVVQGLDEAQQAAQQARTEEIADQRNDNDNQEQAADNSMQEIIDGLPEDTSLPEDRVRDDADVALADANMAQQAADAAAAQAAESQQGHKDAYEAVNTMYEAGGSSTYSDIDGTQHTVTTSEDGTSVSIDNYEYNGQTGTLTTTNGVTTFTPDGGGAPQTVTGTTVQDEILNTEDQWSQKMEEDSAKNGIAQAEAQAANEKAQQEIEQYNEQARQEYENERDPDSGNGGYSESDSSNWHSDDYDPSEWGGF